MEQRAALSLIRRLVQDRAVVVDPHLYARSAARHIPIDDIFHAVARASEIKPHDRLPLNEGGESWRVFGRTTDGVRIGVGVELVRQPDDRWVVLVTVINDGG